MDVAIQGFSALEDTLEMSQTLEEKKETFIKDLLQKSSFGPSLPKREGESGGLGWFITQPGGGLQPPELL